jgi:CRISPR/Cas system CSM-associated protein Csm3 (group 7 of RAMP superfamily)
MKFTIEFRTPFRVATGRSGEGADSTVDSTAMLPASSLKGIMRSAARDLLRLDQRWVDLVYGTAWSPSPWAWSDATVESRSAVAPGADVEPGAAERSAASPAPTRMRARIQITAETSTVTRGALAIAEEVLAHQATFTVTRVGWIKAHRDRHEQILIASTRAVTALGGDRRRGLGWVSITPLEPPWDPGGADELVTSLLDLRNLEVPR